MLSPSLPAWKKQRMWENETEWDYIKAQTLSTNFSLLSNNYRNDCGCDREKYTKMEHYALVEYVIN